MGRLERGRVVQHGGMVAGREWESCGAGEARIALRTALIDFAKQQGGCPEAEGRGSEDEVRPVVG